MKKQAIDWDKIFKVNICDRGLLPIIYKEPQISNKKTSPLRSKRLEQTLDRGKYIQKAKKYIKDSASLIITEM